MMKNALSFVHDEVFNHFIIRQVWREIKNREGKGQLQSVWTAAAGLNFSLLFIRPL